MGTMCTHNTYIQSAVEEFSSPMPARKKHHTPQDGQPTEAPYCPNPNAVQDCGQDERGATEDETTGRHHQLNVHELEKTPGDSEGQGSLACCSP